MTAPHVQQRNTTTGGRFDFDDGGTYCGGWEDGKAHGHGVCTGPRGQGEYSGSWHFGFEVSGVYIWPSGSTYEGQWQNGKRHGLGTETRGRWVYRGEWTQGLKGRYGVRQSLPSGAKYEGTWAVGLQDGYGSETYADGGIYQGQWLRGLRHGYGVRTSAPFGLASLFRPKSLCASLTSLWNEHVDPTSERDRKIDDCRGGFVLKARSDDPPPRRRSLVEKSSNLKKFILRGLRLRKQRSTGDIDRRGGPGSIRSTGSTGSSGSSGSSFSRVTRTSANTDSNMSFVSQDDITDANVVETYMGEWKNDKRCGFGISERTDGIKYEGEWHSNKKHGYGVTTFKDGTKDEGKYKSNVLVTSGKKKHLFLLRSSKFRNRIDGAVNAAARASQIALQKADIAISRTATARGKAEDTNIATLHAREDSDLARIIAKQFAPEFHQPGTDLLKRKKMRDSKEHSGIDKIRRPSSIIPSQHVHQRSHSLYVPLVSASREHLASNPKENEHRKPTISDTLTLNTDRRESHVREITPNREQTSLDPSMVNETLGRSPQGYFRCQNNLSFRKREESLTLQQVMSDHLDQYSHEHAGMKPRFRGSQSPQRMPFPQLQNISHHTAEYGPECTPDSGVSESMDNDGLYPGHVPRRSTLPNLYTERFEDQTDPELICFAPSDSEAEGNGSTLTPQPDKTSCATPHRTASLYGEVTMRQVKPNKSEVTARKKSLPDLQAAAMTAKLMTRAEVSELSTQKREEVRRMMLEAERLRANPLLHLFNPRVKEWFSRQQLVIMVLLVNISLAIMFFKLLT